MPERFIVGHLEDHVRQLEGILGGPDAGATPHDPPRLGSSLPEIVLRTAIVYLFLVLILRLTGKREVGQMSILELIVILVISDAVQNSMVGENTSLWGGLVAVVTLFAADYLLKFAADRSRRLRRPSRASRGSSSATAASSPRPSARRAWTSRMSGPPLGAWGSPGSRTSDWRSSRPTDRSASSRWRAMPSNGARSPRRPRGRAAAARG